MNITLDDTSPMITYGPPTGNGWQKQHGNDAKTWLYYKETVTATSVDSDFMTIEFRGSGIICKGAMKGDHGMFSSETLSVYYKIPNIDGTAQLDDGRVSHTLGYSAQEQFQATLFEQRGLDPNVVHRLTLTNLPSRTSPPGSSTVFWYLDIDEIIIEVPQPDAFYTTVYDNNSTSIAYQGAWLPVPEASLTSELGASFTFPFNGTAVEVRGALGVDHHEYSVELDGASHTYNGSFFRTENDATLYLATGLDESKPHTLKITNVGSTQANTSVFEVDRIIVNSTTAPSESDGASVVPSGGQTDTSGSSSGPNVGAIAGGVVGGVLALALIAFALWFFCVRRKRRSDQTEPVVMVDTRSGTPVTREGSTFAQGEIVPFTKSHSQLDIAVPTLPATPTHQRSDTSTTLPMASTYVSTLAMSPTSDTFSTNHAIFTSPTGLESEETPLQGLRERYLSMVPAPPPSNTESYLLSPFETSVRSSQDVSGHFSIPAPPASDASSYPMSPADATKPALATMLPAGAARPVMHTSDSSEVNASTTAVPSRASTDMEFMLKRGFEQGPSTTGSDSPGSVGATHGATLDARTPPWLKVEMTSPGRANGTVDADGREIDAGRIMGETLPPAYEQVPR